MLVKLNYCDLNYKDGLILNRIARLVRNYPHIPGIGFSGVVEASDSPDDKAGDEVLLTGWGLGDLPKLGSRILKGQVPGRTVIDVNR